MRCQVCGRQMQGGRAMMAIKPGMHCLLISCFVFCITASYQARAQGNGATPTQNPQAAPAGVTPYSDAIPNSTDLLRRKRSDRYNSRPGTPPLDEDSYPTLEVASSDPAELPDLPVNKSDAIIVGSIAAQHAYLSSDRTAIYTEFKVQVEQYLKAPKDLPLPAGAGIEVERQGGSIQFSSDVTISRGLANKSLPWVGKRYLLFLDYRPEGKDFSLMTGYRLEGALVVPLDKSDTGPGSTESVQDKDALPPLPPPLPDPRTEFVTGTSEVQLLAKVKAVIAAGP
jgi:hypothetical protein